MPDSIYSQAKLDTITQKSILAGKTLIRTRKLPMSFRDNIRVSVIVYRVSVIVHIKMIKISCKTVFS